MPTNAIMSLADGTTMNTSLDGVTTVVDFFFENFASLVSTISAQPLLLIPVGVYCCGAIIGLAKRLIG